MHWQASATNKYYNELQSKTDAELQDELKLCRDNYDKALEEAIKYHGSEDKITHGFFAGKIYAATLFCNAVAETIYRREHKLGEREPLPENAITIWRK